MTKVLNVVYTPEQILDLVRLDLGKSLCVVIDALRATSTMVTGLAHGVLAFFPVAELEEARALRKAHPELLLGGERGGIRPDGFDFGNSPLEYTQGQAAGRRVAVTTTNGTLALLACRHAARTVAGSFLNFSAVVEEVRRHQGPVYLVCAGTGPNFALEDALVAGAIADGIGSKHPISALYRSTAHDLPGAFGASQNARRLREIDHAADVEWCIQIDRYPIVPRLGADGWLAAE